MTTKRIAIQLFGGPMDGTWGGFDVTEAEIDRMRTIESGGDEYTVDPEPTGDGTYRATWNGRKR